jgi:hypothetical protein
MTDAAGMEASGPAEGGEGRGEQGCRETPVGPVSFTRGAAVQCGSGFALAVCADTGLVITSNPYTCTLSVFEITMSAPGTGSPSSRGPRTDGEGAAVDDSGDGKSSPQPSQSASPTFTLVRTIGRAGDGPLEFDRPCFMCPWRRVGASQSALRLLVVEWGNDRVQEVDVVGGSSQTHQHQLPLLFLGSSVLPYPSFSICSTRVPNARHFFPRHCVGPHHCRWPCSSYRSHRSQNLLPCCYRVQLGRTLPSGLLGTCASPRPWLLARAAP